MSRCVKSQKPNILLIMADDMGFSDIGCYGSEIPTPNIDRLAKEGLRFKQFYNTARCCPTRASLLTGLYQHQAGVGHMNGNRGYPSYQGYLNKNCVTIAELMRSGGYRTMITGKWHVGDVKGQWPTDRGFDRFFGVPAGGGVYFYPFLKPNRKVYLNETEFIPDEKFYSTDAFTDYALEFLEEAYNDGLPFFMYVAHIAPHFPIQAWPDDIKKYRGKYSQGWEKLRKQRHQYQIDLGIVDSNWPLSPSDVTPWEDIEDKDEMDLRMAIYAAQIDCLDRNIGRLLDKLDELGLTDNTLVMFLSDNGGTHEGGVTGFDHDPKGILGTVDSYSSYGQGWANASNTPFRLYKHWVHEGGISTPFIARWPHVIPRPGKMTGQVAHCIDLLATCIDAAGIEYPSVFNGKSILPTAGKSLVPVFRGEQREPHPALFWEHMGNRAVRSGKWKLVSRHKNKWELYDLEADRTELYDLAGRYPDKVMELKKLYDRWAERCGVLPWPVDKNQ
ncbi:arylsulfatase [candidate division KSB1 bacterium]|nr:arylsulfatase [candidate division KSB1 bacterium]